ncbi:MAG: hypothetical protein HRT40_11800 [Campylobacteraceae bacterium]|nr:hypothetical protein [Campylobacteraceae bacterium]
MKYISTKEATNWPKKEGISHKLVRLVYSLVPNANPRYKHHYHLINEWYIEFDDNGNAKREIGIDSKGKVILASPFKQNPGFWIESKMNIEDVKNEEISSEKFTILWNKYFS